MATRQARAQGVDRQTASERERHREREQRGEQRLGGRLHQRVPKPQAHQASERQQVTNAGMKPDGEQQVDDGGERQAHGHLAGTAEGHVERRQRVLAEERDVIGQHPLVAEERSGHLGATQQIEE